MKKIVITGATSMIGMALVEALLTEKLHIYTVVRKTNERLESLSKEGKLTVILSAMEDYGHISEKIHDTVDMAVLMAWNGTRGENRNKADIQAANYRCNIAILPELVKMGCKKIVSAGSQAEYGPWNLKRKLSEQDIPNPNTEYGKQKLAFYEYASKFAMENGLRIIEPRFFSLYGPNDFEGTLIMSMLRNMQKNEPCKMTQCIQSWDYLYIDDAISALKKLVLGDYHSGIYNFGSGENHSLRYYVEIMYRETGSNSELLFGAVPYPATGMVNINPDVSKLFAIGWKPQISFEEGIRKILSQREFTE